MTTLNKEEKRTFKDIFGEIPVCLASFNDNSGISFYCLELGKRKQYAVVSGTWTNGREDWILPTYDVNFTLYDTETTARLKFALALQTFIINAVIGI